MDKKTKTILKLFSDRKKYITLKFQWTIVNIYLCNGDVSSFNAIRLIMCFTAINDIIDSTTGMAEYWEIPRPSFFNLPRTPSVE